MVYLYRTVRILKPNHSDPSISLSSSKGLRINQKSNFFCHAVGQQHKTVIEQVEQTTYFFSWWNSESLVCLRAIVKMDCASVSWPHCGWMGMDWLLLWREPLLAKLIREAIDVKHAIKQRNHSRVELRIHSFEFCSRARINGQWAQSLALDSIELLPPDGVRILIQTKFHRFHHLCNLRRWNKKKSFHILLYKYTPKFCGYPFAFRKIMSYYPQTSVSIMIE